MLWQIVYGHDLRPLIVLLLVDDIELQRDIPHLQKLVVNLFEAFLQMDLALDALDALLRDFDLLGGVHLSVLVYLPGASILPLWVPIHWLSFNFCVIINHRPWVDFELLFQMFNITPVERSRPFVWDRTIIAFIYLLLVQNAIIINKNCVYK